MAEQTISLGDRQKNANNIVWGLVSNRPRVSDSFGSNAFLTLLSITSDGIVGLGCAGARTGGDGSWVDLSDLFETSGSIIITAAGSSVTLLMGGDRSAPYSLTDSANMALASAWFATLPDGVISGVTLTLRDFVRSAIPVPLAGRLATALSVSAALTVVTIAPVPLTARLSVALSVSAAAPRATAASVVLNAEQFIDLGPPNRFTERAIGWDSISFRIDDSLAPRSRWLRGMVIFGRTGAANLNFEADATQVSQFRADLLEKFETNGSITITANGSSVTLAVVDQRRSLFLWRRCQSGAWQGMV